MKAGIVEYFGDGVLLESPNFQVEGARGAVRRARGRPRPRLVTGRGLRRARSRARDLLTLWLDRLFGVGSEAARYQPAVGIERYFY